MPRITVLDTFSIPVPRYDRLNELGTVKVFTDKPESEEMTVSRGEGADVLVLNKTAVTESVLEKLPDVKLIVETASGYDNIDVKAAAARNIPVANAPGYSTDSVAELVFALLGSVVRNIPACQKQVKRGEWLDEPLLGGELCGGTLGVVGFGKIGQAVCRIARGYAMNILVYTGHPEKYKHEFADYTFAGLEELLKQSDAVTLHIPHTDETDRLINAERISMMKQDAVLINTARGKVVDETALIAALKEKRIRAGLDVLEVEPMVKDHEIPQLENAVLAPHVGWYTDQAIDRLMDMVYDNIAGYFAGKPVNVVN